jgi:hypothetical protein
VGMRGKGQDAAGNSPPTQRSHPEAAVHTEEVLQAL